MRARHWLALGMIAGGCLPDDVRPEPAEILVTAEPSEATSQGFTTADGWTVTFDRFVTAIGHVDLDDASDNDDGSCNGYSDTHYDWLFDFAVAGREKVGIVYGLGACSVEYRVRSPSDDAILGPGATQQDVDFMRTEAVDIGGLGERVSLLVQGSATRGGDIKRFDWSFRHSHEVSRCTDLQSGEIFGVLELKGGERHELRVVVAGEELFRRAAADDAALEFELFAEADADADGSITLDELTQVAAPVVDEPPSDPEGFVPATLADLVYALLVPRVTRFEGGGSCETELRDR